MIVTDAQVCIEAFIHGSVIKDYQYYILVNPTTQDTTYSVKYIEDINTVQLQQGERLILVAHFAADCVQGVSPCTINCKTATRWWNKNMTGFVMPFMFIRTWTVSPKDWSEKWIVERIIRAQFASKFLFGDSPDNRARRVQLFGRTITHAEMHALFQPSGRTLSLTDVVAHLATNGADIIPTSLLRLYLRDALDFDKILSYRKGCVACICYPKATY